MDDALRALGSPQGRLLADQHPRCSFGFLYHPYLMDTVILYRPVGPVELGLIRESGWKKFPPRLPEQPIFYPVTNEHYATQIARDWNVRDTGSGFVTRFAVRADYLSRFPVRKVGASEHTEYWIPAEELPHFNENIVGLIEVIQEFGPTQG